MTYTVGDMGTQLIGTCSDEVTGAVDITGCSIELHVLVPHTGTVLTRTATVTDGPTGKWSYIWATDDLTESGFWAVEAQVSTGDGLTVQTFGPATFEVVSQIA